MATDDSYYKLHTALRSHDNYTSEVFPATVNELRSELNLDSVKSCLTFGPGAGQREVYFIKQCVPNISKLIAVEPDHESAERLRARLEKSLPGVDSQVFETTIQSWKGLDDPVDLVLMISVLYYVNQNERKELFKKLHEQWLTTGGRVVVVSAIRTKCPGSGHEHYARLGSPLLSWEDIEPDILEAGLTKQHAHEMQITRNYSNLDESFLRFYEKRTHQPLTLDDIRNTIKELFPGGKTDQLFNIFVVFQNVCL